MVISVWVENFFRVRWGVNFSVHFGGEKMVFIYAVSAVKCAVG